MPAKLTACIRLALAALLLAAATLASPVLAQDAKGEARQLGIEGVKAFEAGDWQGAVSRFQKAEELYHAPTHLLYIARAQVKLMDEDFGVSDETTAIGMTNADGRYDVRGKAGIG